MSGASLETYAGTASRWGQRFICSVCVQHDWELFTWDVSTAFLQAVSFEELAAITGEPMRRVSLTPPKGSEKYFGELKGLNVDYNTHTL